VTSVPAADVEGAVLDHVQKVLAAPELLARTWATAKREGDNEITEREVTALLAEFATVWSELFPAEQARIVQLLVERVDVQEDALEVRIRAEGLASLVGEAIRLAKLFHPNHVVSVRLERSTRYYYDYRGREFFDFRVV
jgi:hypothetical protein